MLRRLLQSADCHNSGLGGWLPPLRQRVPTTWLSLALCISKTDSQHVPAPAPSSYLQDWWARTATASSHCAEILYTAASQLG
jgi:hypothetical protein